MAAAAFSIRGYAASMRGEAAAEGRRPLGIEHLPPIRAPRFRWWADELATAVAAASSPRRSPGKARPPKKRSISDLFASAPPLGVPPAGDSGCSEKAEVDGDEALCAIVRRAKEEKKRKRRLQEAAAAPESAGSRDPEGNFTATKSAPSLGALGAAKVLVHPVVHPMEAHENPILPDGLDSRPSQKPEASEHCRKGRENISGRRKKGQIKNPKKKKADTQKCIDNNKAGKVGKPRDLRKSLPSQGILKYTKHVSVKMAKEKHLNSKGNEVIELCCKSVKRVKFSEVDGVPGNKMQSCELPKRRSLCKLFSDAMASSSSSPSSSSSSSSSVFIEEDKCANAESSSPHMPKEAFTVTKEANKHCDHDESAGPINREMHAPLIDLNMAPPEYTDLDGAYDSNIEMLESQPPAADFERIRSSSSPGTFLHSESTNVSNMDAVGSPLSLREPGETRRGCSNVSVKDTMATSASPCVLPDHTFQDSFQQHKNMFSSILSNGASQLSRECNVSRSTESYSRSELHVQHECSPSMGQTFRLMGKDLAVHATRDESFSKTAQKPTVTSTSTIQASTYHASTSQRHFGYRTPHDSSHPFPAANVFSGNQLPYANRYLGFSNSQTNQTFLLGCPPLPNHGSAALHQNPPPPWRYFSDPIAGAESLATQLLPISRQHGTPSSVFHDNLPRQANWPQQNVVHSASSTVCPLNSVSYTLSHPGQVVQEVYNSTRDAALSSKNPENRTGRAVPDNTNASSSGLGVQKRSGPVKLTPGAKHILVPSDSTHGNSAPVYSCLSFASRGGNAARSQNKGA